MGTFKGGRVKGQAVAASPSTAKYEREIARLTSKQKVAVDGLERIQNYAELNGLSRLYELIDEIFERLEDTQKEQAA